jgi:hypothetical protein
VKRKLNLVLAPDFLQYAPGLRDHFPADAVARDHGNAK